MTLKVGDLIIAGEDFHKNVYFHLTDATFGDFQMKYGETAVFLGKELTLKTSMLKVLTHKGVCFVFPSLSRRDFDVIA